MADENNGARWTATFERLPEEKRRRVFEAAKRAFAASGFAGANVNKIAEDAGISVGSMYKYFRTKEDLFLSLVESLRGLIASTIDGVLVAEPTFAGRVEALLRAAVDSSLADPEAVSLYIACTTEEMSRLASKLTLSIEEVSAGRYRAMIAEAQSAGEVDAALDPGWAAFFLDDLLMLAQFSSGSVYYRERLGIFLGRPRGEGVGWDPEALVATLLGYALRALGA